MKRKIIIFWNLEESVVYILRIEDIPEDHRLDFYCHESIRCCLNENPFFIQFVS